MKKILAIVLVVALTAAVSIAGTMAYLTSSDSDVNVMTLGNVKIQQNEQQRVEANGEFTAELEPFAQGKILLPVTYPGNRTTDTVTIGDYTIEMKDNEANYVDKIVSVTNTGSEAAYVRTLVAVPTGGADWEPTPVSANNCWLHWNFPAETLNHWTLVSSDVPMIEIEGENYYVWEFVHKTALASKKTTYPVIRGFYMDQKVNHDANGYFMTYADGTTKRIEDVAFGDTVNVLVLSQAVQTAGFSDASTALDAGFGDVTAENAAVWFGAMEAPEVVDNAEELAAALASGATEVILNKGSYTMPTTTGEVAIHGDKDTVISGNNATADKVTLNGVTVQSTGAAYTGIKHSKEVVYNNVTIVGNMYLYAKNVVFNNCTFDLSKTNDYVWIYGATNVEFNNCTFNTMGKAILVYQDGSKVDQTVKVEGCTFNASAPAYNSNKTIHIAAVSIDGSQGGTYNVILNNNTVDSDFNGLWQDKTSAGNITVTVDGTEVLTATK